MTTNLTHMVTLPSLVKAAGAKAPNSSRNNSPTNNKPPWSALFSNSSLSFIHRVSWRTITALQHRSRISSWQLTRSQEGRWILWLMVQPVGIVIQRTAVKAVMLEVTWVTTSRAVVSYRAPNIGPACSISSMHWASRTSREATACQLATTTSRGQPRPRLISLTAIHNMTCESLVSKPKIRMRMPRSV